MKCFAVEFECKVKQTIVVAAEDAEAAEEQAIDSLIHPEVKKRIAEEILADHFDSVVMNSSEVWLKNKNEFSQNKPEN